MSISKALNKCYQGLCVTLKKVMILGEIKFVWLYQNWLIVVRWPYWWTSISIYLRIREWCRDLVDLTKIAIPTKKSGRCKILGWYPMQKDCTTHQFLKQSFSSCKIKNRNGEFHIKNCNNIPQYRKTSICLLTVCIISFRLRQIAYFDFSPDASLPVLVHLPSPGGWVRLG